MQTTQVNDTCKLHMYATHVLHMQHANYACKNTCSHSKEHKTNKARKLDKSNEHQRAS